MTEQATNSDPWEVAKFDALASRWWDPHSEFKTLHDINPLRLDYIVRFSAGLAGKSVLDIGCGGGILAEALAQQGADVTAIDLAAAPLEVARLHRLESGVDIDYQQISAEELAAQRPGQWDVVTCMELLEHVPRPASTISACAALVKPGGHVFLSTLNRNPKAYLQAIVGAEYLLRMLPRGTHDYARFIRPAELGRWLRQAGLTLDDLTGLSYNPIARTYSLGRDIDVNYLAHARRGDDGR
jgi:2-polyprenyl-6-hydroxyphenyl methylase/3-demethylubiquinone-9 3-methyltransferase